MTLLRYICVLAAALTVWPAKCDDLAWRSVVKISPTSSYFCDLPYAQVEATHEWRLGTKLPLSFAEAIKIARRKLASLTNPNLWYVSEISFGPYYSITLCKNSNAEDYRYGIPVEGEATFLISNSGTLGKITQAQSLSDQGSILSYVTRLSYKPDGNVFSIHRGATSTNVLDRAAILNAPAWKPSLPLPFSVEDATHLARKTLSVYVDDANSWKSFCTRLRLLPGTNDRWYYSFYFVLPAETKPVQTAYGEIVFLVTMDGTVSQIKAL